MALASWACGRSPPWGPAHRRWREGALLLSALGQRAALCRCGRAHHGLSFRSLSEAGEGPEVPLGSACGQDRRGRVLSARQGEARGSRVWGTPSAGCGQGQADEKGTAPRVSSQRPTCGFVQQTQWQDEPHSLWGTLAGADLTCVGLRIVPRVLSLCRAAFGSWRLSDPGSESFSDRPRRVRSWGEAGSAAPRGPRWWARAFAERAVPSGLHGEGQRDWGKAWASAGLLLRPACVRQSVSCCCFVIS